MKEEYNRYIDIFILTRADVYYINGYYLKASLLYSRALKKALLYNGDLKSIEYAITNIKKQMHRSQTKHKQQNYHRNKLSNYITYYKYSLKGYYCAIVKRQFFIY